MTPTPYLRAALPAVLAALLGWPAAAPAQPQPPDEALAVYAGKVEDDEPVYRGKPAAYWRDSLKADDAWVRWRAVRGLDFLEASDPDTVQAVAGLLADKRVKVRIAVGEYLARLGAEAVPAAKELTAALGDVEPTVRQLAAEALTEAGGPDAVGPVAKLLADKDEGVRVAAVEAVAALAPADAPKLLVPALTDMDAFVRVRALAAIRGPGASRTGPPSWSPVPWPTAGLSSAWKPWPCSPTWRPT